MEEFLEIIKQYIPTAISVLTAIVAVLKLIKETTDKNETLRKSFRQVADKVGSNEGTMQKVLTEANRTTTQLNTIHKSMILLTSKIEKLEAKNQELFEKLQAKEEAERIREIEENQLKGE